MIGSSTVRRLALLGLMLLAWPARANPTAASLTAKIEDQWKALANSNVKIRQELPKSRSWQAVARAAIGVGGGVGIGVTKGQRAGRTIWSVFVSAKAIPLGFGAMLGGRRTDLDIDLGMGSTLMIPVLEHSGQPGLDGSRFGASELVATTIPAAGTSRERGFGLMATRHEGAINISLPVFWKRSPALKTQQRAERLLWRAARALRHGKIQRAERLSGEADTLLAELRRLGTL